MKHFYFLFFIFFAHTIKAQVINFTDINFKNYLLSADASNYVAQDVNHNFVAIDTNSNGEIEENEALLIYALTVSGNTISNLDGLNFFLNLNDFNFYGNDQISLLDITFLTNLKTFYCGNNLTLVSINLEGLSNLEIITINENPLFSELNTNGLVSLIEFDVQNNELFTQHSFNSLSNLEIITCNTLSSLSIDGLPNLKDIYGYTDYTYSSSFNSISLTNLPNFERLFVQYTALSSLTLSNLPKLYVLWIPYNQLTQIDLSNLQMNGDNNYGTHFYANDNLLTSLDFSNTLFSGKMLDNNLLDYLNIKDSYNLDATFLNASQYLSFENNPNLQFICVNDEPLDVGYGAIDDEFTSVQNLLNQYGYTNCVINSYCSFVPGEEYYTVTGNVKFDANNNGCDVDDVVFPNMKYAITDGTNSGTFISNNLGYFNIPLVAGSYVITPIIENPNYFTISPATINVDFPVQSSPLNQDFCITSNEINNDLEVTLLPITNAVAGYDASYVLTYKNKGNSIQSGSILLSFEGDKMDFVESTPNFSTQSPDELMFDYSNLNPFETREINVVFNIHSPTDNLPLNFGDLLSFNATIYPTENDALPTDNVSSLDEIVLNSFDPNDKTCLEGTVVGTEMIGEYVHYIIRFENTGNFAAQNIVVKDLIDTSKFDVSTLIPLSSSHDFFTRINGNKVEFIFENINLPSDDANNDGYVAFKIKTVPTLIEGDTFTNNASIYFDYNFPIVTNTASTTIQALKNQDFEFTTYFSLYPNPAKNVLSIKTKTDATISSISIYNALGQLIIVETKPTATIDVSSLKTGTYFIKVSSDKGTSNTKFIKE